MSFRSGSRAHLPFPYIHDVFDHYRYTLLLYFSTKNTIN